MKRSRIEIGAIVAFAAMALAVEQSLAEDIHVPADYATVQSAIDASASGDVVILDPGVYAEVIDFDGKAITVRSVDPDDRSVVESTILDGTGLGSSVVTFDSDEGDDSLLWGVTVTGGSAQYGGGIRCASSAPTIRQCVVIGNEATDYGGGIYGLFASPVIDRCRLIGNSAERGGGYYAFEGALTMVQSEVVWNAATLGGGGAEVWDTDVAMTNCTFGENVSAESTHGLRVVGACSGVVHNSIFAGVFGAHVGGGSPLPALSHCIVRGGYGGDSVFDADPIFLDADGVDNIPGTVDDDFRLNRFSPGADAGWNGAPGLASVTTDFNGLPRLLDDGTVADTGSGKGALVDLGAHERQDNSALRVLTIAPADGLQNSIDASVDGDELVLSPGVYHETVDLRGKSIHLRSMDPSDMKVVEATIIDGSSSSGSVVRCFDVLGAVIEGLTVQGGHGAEAGGGMYVSLSAVTVRRCIIRNNSADFGGGMLIGSTVFDVCVSHCVFENNTAFASGGGALLDSVHSCRLSDCVFRSNTSLGSGGGVIDLGGGSSLVTDCIMHDNEAVTGGGAAGCTLIRCDVHHNHASSHGGGVATGRVVNSTIRSNTCGLRGGGLYNVSWVANSVIAQNEAGTDGGGYYGQGFVWNATIVENTSGGDGSAVRWTGSSPLPISNSIIWGHGSDSISHVAAPPVVEHCNVEGGYVGEGNIDVAPLFVDASSGDYRLMPDSPCIDAGRSDLVPMDVGDVDRDGDFDELMSTDHDGRARVVDGNDDGNAVADLGAFEFGPSVCAADVSGDGVVGADDLLLLLASWGSCAECALDLNDDGVVDATDLLLLFEAWGDC